MRIQALILFAALAVAACSNRDTAPDAGPVIAAERAFAAEAGEIGWVEAFAAHSTDEAVLLAAGPENAHVSLAGIDPANRGDTSLAWAPEFAGISRGGDIGFTTGPFNGDDTAFGQYFTVWRLQNDGTWKWIYDGGTNQRTPTQVNPQAQVRQLALGRGAGSAEAAIAAVREREAAFAEQAAHGAGPAFAAWLAEGGRVNRDDLPSADSPDAVTQIVGAGGVRYEQPLIIEAGVAGDLVFTLGEARWEGGFGYYCRIWVLTSGGWKIGFDQIVVRAEPSTDARLPEDPPAP